MAPYLALLLVSVFGCSATFGLSPGEPCSMGHGNGVCKYITECPQVIEQFRKSGNYYRCGFEGRKIVACCPADLHESTSTTSQPDRSPSPSVSERKCTEYSAPPPIVIQIGSRIMAGEEAKPMEFPHMALIGFENADGKPDWRCGGTLISDQYILTAAQCLGTRTKGAPKYVRLGDSDISSHLNDLTTFNIAEIIRHPDYKPPRVYNDIGLIKLDRKVSLSDSVRPACLPTFASIPENAVATGWGKTEFEQQSTRLQKVTLQIESPPECNGTYVNRLRLPNGIREDTQICAGTSMDTKNTCEGDGGGPLQITHPHISKMSTVIGIISFGIPCGYINTASVFTRVHPFVSWIEDIVWRDS